MTICPCCGYRFSGAMSDGCRSCGSVPVGEALPRPDHELPSYGRSLLVCVIGSVMVLVFLIQTVIALLKNAPTSGFWSWISSQGFWSWVAAAETAAWRLKWIAIPITIVGLWGSRKLYRSMLETPSRFSGLGFARGGLVASAFVTVLIAVLIGVTVPTRLEHRKWGIEAGALGRGRRLDRALRDYHATNKTLPDNPIERLKSLPDPDGSIAEAMKGMDWSTYKASTAVAALPAPKTNSLRGAVIRRASSNTVDDVSPEGVAFDTYELTLPGVDGTMGTEDDLIMKDGFIELASEVARKTKARATSAAATRP